MKVRKWAFIILSAIVIAITVVLMLNSLLILTRGETVLPLANGTSVTAQVGIGGGGGILPSSVGIFGFVLLILAMGLRMIGVVLALVTVIAVFQTLGSGYTLIAYAFALGLAVSALSRGVRPLIRVPTSVAMLMAVVGAIIVALSDMSLFANAVLFISILLAELLAAFFNAMGVVGALVVVGWVLAAGWVARAAAGARGVAGTALSVAAAILGIQVGVILLEFLLSAAINEIGVAVLLVAGIVAIIDMFQALERGRIEALIWTAPLALLASALYDIQLAPIIAGMAGVAAVLGAFTLSDRWVNTAVVLALSALVLI